MLITTTSFLGRTPQRNKTRCDPWPEVRVLVAVRALPPPPSAVIPCSPLGFPEAALVAPPPPRLPRHRFCHKEISRSTKLGQRGKGGLKVPPSTPELPTPQRPFLSSVFCYSKHRRSWRMCKPLKGRSKGREREQFRQRIWSPVVSEDNGWKPVEASRSEKARGLNSALT